MLAPHIYQQRRLDLAARIGQGLILLPGNGESPMNYADNTYPFRQDSTFLYYFGIDRPGLVGLIDAEQGISYLFGDDYALDWIVWMGPQPLLADLAAQVGAPQHLGADELSGHLHRAWKQGRKVHYLPPYRAETRHDLHRWLELSPAEVDGRASKTLVLAVVAQRSIKQAEEIAEMELATRITGEMHLAAMRMARPGIGEAAVMAAVHAVPLRYGAQPSFTTICSVRGEVLHNHHYPNTLQAGQLLLCDAGAEAPSHYAGDMTRTVPVSGRFDTRQREVYAIVLDAQMQAIAAIAPGVRYKDIHLLAARRITEGLQQLGLMQGDVEASLAAGAHALFFPHGLGHMIGLDVHDMENLGEDHVGYGGELKRSSQFGLRSLRLARTLEPGFVLTVEPGIYFIPPLFARWQAEGHCAAFLRYDKIAAYMDFGGIRIEDDCLVTETGYRILGDPIPKTIEDVEETLAAARSEK
ncbi:MAG: Xaa-Pro aminopeptidase [Bacteroidia bacterium]